MDQHPLFAYSTLAASASSAATTITLVSAAQFPDPASGGAYNAVLWPLNVKPTILNAEVVRVTAKSSNTLTITRAQEGSTAFAFAAGDEVAVAITPKVVTDIEAALAQSATVSISASNMDVAWSWAGARHLFLVCDIGDGTLRNLGAPTFGTGTHLVVYTTGPAMLILHNTAGGGAKFFIGDGASSLLLETGNTAEFIYDGTYWRQVQTPADGIYVKDADGNFGGSHNLETIIDAIYDAFLASLNAHINDTTDAHDASAISVAPTGNLAADDVQEALQELQTDVDTRADIGFIIALGGY